MWIRRCLFDCFHSFAYSYLLAKACSRKGGSAKATPPHILALVVQTAGEASHPGPNTPLGPSSSIERWCLRGRTRPLDCLRLGTDFSGIEAPLHALRLLNVPVQHVFATESDRFARAAILAASPHVRLYHDVSERPLGPNTQVDVYVAGFPCQPFSSQGSRQGEDDYQGRGGHWRTVVEFIDTNLPSFFLLENVQGLLTIEGGKVFKKIIEALSRSGAYAVEHQLINTKLHGLPHNRPRVYIVGILKDCMRLPFSFPDPLPPPRLSDFLGPRALGDRPTRPPRIGGRTLSENATMAFLMACERDLDMELYDCAADISVAQDRLNLMEDCVPCLTTSHDRGPWIVA